MGNKFGADILIQTPDPKAARTRLLHPGCEIIKDEPDFPRCYVRDPFGLIYNLAT